MNRIHQVRRRVVLSLGLVLAALLLMPVVSAAQAPVAGRTESREQQGALQPGDLVRLRIWREPDLSGDFPVHENGIAILPKLGPVDVTRRSLAELKATLLRDYAAFLRNPSIEVVPLHRVRVLGAVHRPGLYPVDPTMSVADAVALAGGVASDGRTNQVRLLREGQRLDITVDQTTRIGDMPIRSGDQLFVPQRSWVSRNPWIFGAVISATTSIVLAAAFR